MRSARPILLVEDDEIDRMMVRRAFHAFGIDNPLLTAGDGEEALKLLRGGMSEKPALILLDLNMPRMNGVEFLQAVKSHDTLRMIPVVVLTTSSEPKDKRECFRLSVAGYLVKPADHRLFEEMIGTIDRYWTASELPDLPEEARDSH